MAKAVEDMLALLVATFGGEVDTWQVRAYKRTIGPVSGQVLLEAADLLINEAAAGRKFYPMPSAPDVKGACNKVIEAKRVQAWLEAIKHCDHPQQFEEITGEDGVVRSQRCSCWKRGKLAMDAAGHPLALPSRTQEIA